MDYASTVPYYKALREKFLKVTDGKSLAPLREMHQLSAVGAGKEMDFDDDTKAIFMGFKVVDDDAWLKVQEGVYTGFSQGGRYVKTWKKGALVYYTADPGEISLVDNPCLPTATFEYIKHGGTTELRKFRAADPIDARLDELVTRLIDRLGKAGKKISAVIGHLKGETSTTVQTVIFAPKDDWTIAEAKGWLKDHDLKATKVDETEDSYRFRQRDTADFEEGSFKTIPFKGGKVFTSGITKRVAGEDLEAGAFAHVGDSEDPKTWRLAIKFTSVDKTVEYLRRAMIGLNRAVPQQSRGAAQQRILAAAKAHGVDVGAEAQKITELYKFLCSGALQKGMWDVKDISDVMCTLAFVQNCLANEREYEGDDSTVPEDLLQVMEDLQQVFLQLVQEETDELIAQSRALGEKTMKPDTLEKALAKLDQHEKALHKLKKMLGDHHDATVDMHKGHHSDMHKTKDHAAAKALSTEHFGKAIAHHAAHLTKAYDHIDKAISDMTGGDKDGAGTLKDEPLTIDTSGVSAHTAAGGKAITVDALQGMLTKQATDLQTIFDKALDQNTTNVLTAIFSADGDVAAAAPGLGDRRQVVATKAMQTHVVTKADDAAASAAAKAEMPTTDDARKAFTGSGGAADDAMLKLARSIKPNTAGVPATLQGRKMFT